VFIILSIPNGIWPSCWWLTDLTCRESFKFSSWLRCFISLRYNSLGNKNQFREKYVLCLTDEIKKTVLFKRTSVIFKDFPNDFCTADLFETFQISFFFKSWFCYLERKSCEYWIKQFSKRLSHMNYCSHLTLIYDINFRVLGFQIFTKLLSGHSKPIIFNFKVES